MTLHPGSGSKRIKHDASDHRRLVEIKDAAMSYALTGKYLNMLWTRAIRQSKEPVLIVKFGNGIIATVTLEKDATITQSTD